MKMVNSARGDHRMCGSTVGRRWFIKFSDGNFVTNDSGSSVGKYCLQVHFRFNYVNDI